MTQNTKITLFSNRSRFLLPDTYRLKFPFLNFSLKFTEPNLWHHFITSNSIAHIIFVATKLIKSYDFEISRHGASYRERSGRFYTLVFNLVGAPIF